MDATIRVSDLFPSQKPKRLRYFVAGFVLALFSVPTVGYISAEKQERESCRNFETQQEAQARFDRFIDDPNYGKYVRDLDRDRDGVACESLPLKQ